MVRTMGGSFYREFINDKFIAFGFNDFLLKDIQNLNKDNKLAIKELRMSVAKKYPDNCRPGHVASQLIKFCRDIKIDDVVLVPSNRSEISIVKVIGSVYEDENSKEDNGKCSFMKRIPIKIIKRISKFSLPPKAMSMFNSRHPISDISNYSMYIDNMVSDFYNKDQETHITLKIDTDDEVSATTFYNIEKLFEITESFCSENNIEGTSDDVSMKVQMESKGNIHFISKNKVFLGLIGLGILFINGGGLKIKNGEFNLDLSTDGIFKKYDEHMDRMVDRDVRLSIKKSLDSLKIKTPEDYKKAVIELYKAQNENRNKY
jgi:hypothetical protein